jgi:hypothetical protein
VAESRVAARSFSFPEVSYGAAAPCRRARTPRRPRPHNGWTADDTRAPLRATVGRRRRRQGRSRRRAPDGLRAGSCERLLERFAATLTGNQNATVSERPHDRASDPRTASELAIAVPHRALKRERQLVATRPSLDDKLAARESAERDRSRRPPVPGPTRERNDPTARGTGRPAAPCTSGTGAPASPAQRATSAPDPGASAPNTDLVGSETQAPSSSADTTHPAMRGGRSTDVLSAGRRALSRAPHRIRSPEAAANPDRRGAHPSAPNRRLQRPSWTLLSAQLGQ